MYRTSFRVIIAHEAFDSAENILLFVTKSQCDFRLFFQMQDVDGAFAPEMQFVANS